MSTTGLQKDKYQDYLSNQSNFWPYKWHMVPKMEILTYLVTLPLGLMHFFDAQNMYGLVIPGCGFLILMFMWHWYGGLQFKLFLKHIIFQFRTMVILFSLLTIVILHTMSYWLLLKEYTNTAKEYGKGDNNPSYSILVAIFDDIFWCLVIFLLIQGDTVYPKPSNFSRFLLLVTDNLIR